MAKKLFNDIVSKLNFSLINRTPVILQSEATECGIACLAMICSFYGLNIDLFNFRKRFGSPSQGVTLMSLSKTAE
ncbi:cysteine peptidase family C39 domain-containing protein, partial [Klebsiella pneumoniae]